MAFRASGFQASRELGLPDLAVMNVLCELGEIAAACSADHRTGDDWDRPAALRDVGVPPASQLGRVVPKSNPTWAS